MKERLVIILCYSVLVSLYIIMRSPVGGGVTHPILFNM